MPPDSLPAGQMRALTEAGEARPLLPGHDVAPTWYQDRWWHVPRDGTDYVPAGDELSAEFDRLRSRVERVDTFRADALNDDPSLRPPG